MVSSCGVRRYCQPSPKSRDFAYVTDIHVEELVTYVIARHYRQRYHIFFKCLPDSIVIGKKVKIFGWEKI